MNMNTFWMVISAILFAALVCCVVILVVFAYLLVQKDKQQKALQFKGLSRSSLNTTTRVLLAKDAKHPKRARYLGKVTVIG